MARAIVEPQLVDVDELARDLVKATANLSQGIAAEAQKRVGALSKTYALAADERIKKVADAAAIEIQRREDVIAELRCQMKYLKRHADRCFRLEKAVKAARADGEDCIRVQALLDIIYAPPAPPETG